MASKKTSAASVRFIFTTIFLDSLGIGLVIPVFPDLIRRFSTDPMFVAEYYGYFMSVYSVMQLAASPVLGSLSDRFGRRPILLCSLLGAALDYLMMAFAPSLGLLFAGRVISGLTGASYTVASSYMADISDDSNRSANFGMIGAAFGMGFIVGPAIGGILGIYSPIAPFIGAAVLNLINFAFGYFILPESLKPENRRQVNLKKLNPLGSILHVLRPSPIVILIWSFVLAILAGQVHPSNWVLYTELKFGWSTGMVGLSLAAVGVSIALVQGGLTRVIIPKLGEPKSALLGLIIAVFGYLAYAFAPNTIAMFMIMLPAAVCGIAGPAMQSIITKATPANEQGEMQGTLVSMTSLMSIIGPLLFTKLFMDFTEPNKTPYFPGIAYVAAAIISVAAIALIFTSKSFRKSLKN